MKREGRQHGVVRSYPILPTPLSRQRRYIKTVDSSSVAGLFTKVSSKPTNQSKFTGKCDKTRCIGCHFHPVCKSKDKSKGTKKLRSKGSDFDQLIGCSAGTSAIDALAYLASYGSHDDSAIDDYDCSDDANDCSDEFRIGLDSNVREELIIGVEDEDEDDGWILA